MYSQFLIQHFPIIAKGGPVMYPIIGLSILGLAIILERFWTLVLRKSRILPRRLFREVQDRVDRGEIGEAITACKRDDSPLARILLAGLQYHRAPREAVRDKLEDTGRREAAGLDRYLATLSTIASVEPLLGLLGTVTGMIRMFGAMVSAEPGNLPRLSAGIGEALITTAGGLAVAIPCYIFYRWYLSRVQHLTLEMEYSALLLLDQLRAEESLVVEKHPSVQEARV